MSFSFPHSLNLLDITSFNFCLLKNHYFTSIFLKEILTWYSNLVWQGTFGCGLFLFCFWFCFSFQQFKYAVPLSSGLHHFRWENYGNYLHSSIHNMWFFLSGCFLRFSLYHWFLPICLWCVLMCFSLCLSYLKFLELFKCVGLQFSANLEHFSHYFFKYLSVLSHPSGISFT